MNLRRVMWAAGAFFYAFLWVLALNGVTSLVAPLTVPVVLALLVYLGIQLNKYLGTAPRRPRFLDPVHDDPVHDDPVHDDTEGDHS